MSRLLHLVLFRPVKFYVLQELAVPGCVHLPAVAPVDDELRQQAAGEVLVDVRHPEDVVHVFRRLPVIADRRGLAAPADAGSIACPLQPDVLDKAGVQFPGRIAALAPVEHELGDRVLDEGPVHPAPGHDIHGVLAGPPGIGQRRGLGPEGLRLLLLVAPPGAGHVLAKLVFPGVADFPALAPVKDEILQLVEGELPRYVVVQAQ